MMSLYRAMYTCYFHTSPPGIPSTIDPRSLLLPLCLQSLLLIVFDELFRPTTNVS